MYSWKMFVLHQQIQKHQQKVIFLHQVDDFAIACEDSDTAKQVTHNINSKMTIDVKELGIIQQYNGVDVQQTQQYIKLHNTIYW